MPTYFEIVKAALDDAYSEFGSNEKATDDAVKSRLQELSDRYKDVLNQGGPDYSDGVTRFAYLFRYASAHADYLNTIILSSKDVQSALNSERVHISCIGGGPGSDVLGFLKFIMAQKDKPKLTYFIMDKETGWADTWAELDAIVSKDLQTSRTFFTIDVTKPDTYKKFSKPYRSNIFTMLYFLSEVFKFRDDVEIFLLDCFSRMEKDSIFIILDFHYSDLETWIDGLIESSGLEVLRSQETQMTVEPAEEKNALKQYMEKFGYPKLQSKVFVRVLRKP